jgi:uncharacterized protein YbjT (DUF2867 family)
MIAVVGGTGTVGTAAVRELAAAGLQVRVLSRNAPEQLPAGATHLGFDLAGDDHGSALAGVDVVLDLANSSTRPGRVLLEGTSGLLDACHESGVGHYVGISIVGCEQVGLGYYKAKARQEELIRNSPVPWSLLRASQFHELLDSLMSGAAKLRLLPGGDARFQPIAAAEVGKRLAGIARKPPTLAAEQITGPEIMSLRELARVWQEVSERRCVTVPLPLPGRTGRAIRDGAFTDEAASVAGPGFRQWLETRQPN